MGEVADKVGWSERDLVVNVEQTILPLGHGPFGVGLSDALGEEVFDQFGVRRDLVVFQYGVDPVERVGTDGGLQCGDCRHGIIGKGWPNRRPTNVYQSTIRTW